MNKEQIFSFLQPWFSYKISPNLHTIPAGMQILTWNCILTIKYHCQHREKRFVNILYENVMVVYWNFCRVVSEICVFLNLLPMKTVTINEKMQWKLQIKARSFM